MKRRIKLAIGLGAVGLLLVWLLWPGADVTQRGAASQVGQVSPAGDPKSERPPATDADAPAQADLAASAGAPLAPDAGEGPKDAVDAVETLPILVKVLRKDDAGRLVAAAGATVYLDDHVAGSTDQAGEAELIYKHLGFAFDFKLRAAKGEERSELVPVRWPTLPASELVLTLLGTGRVAGKVLGLDGAPVQGARVWIYDIGVPETRSAADGGFLLGGVAAGRQTVRAANERGGTHKELLVRSGEPSIVTLTLKEEITQYGRVESPQGIPIEGAKIDGTVVAAKSKIDLLSDRAGRFSFQTEPSSRWMLLAEKEEASKIFVGPRKNDRQHPQVVVLGEPAESPAEDLGSLELHLSQPNGNPATDIQPEIVDPKGGFVVEQMRSPGRWFYKDLKPVLWKIRYELKGGSAGQKGTLGSVQIVGGEHAVFEKVVAIEGELLEGQVVDASDGAPIAGAEVLLGLDPRPDEFPQDRFFGRAAVCSKDGRFHLRGALRKHELLRAQAPGYAPSFTVVPATGELRIALERSRSVTGRVLGAEGAPLHSFIVDDKTHEAPDGRFEQLVAASHKTLRVWATDLAPHEVPIPAGAWQTELGDISLGELTPVPVLVLDPAGQPLAGAVIRGFRPNAATYAPKLQPIGTTDATGRAELKLQPGSRRLVVWHPALGLNTPRVRPTPCQPGELLTFRYQQPAYLELQEDRPNLRTLVYPGRYWRETLGGPADASGHLRLGPLAPGTYTVVALDPGARTHQPGYEATVVLSPGQTQALHFPLAQP